MESEGQWWRLRRGRVSLDMMMEDEFALCEKRESATSWSAFQDESGDMRLAEWHQLSSKPSEVISCQRQSEPALLDQRSKL
jgi:hypothetical protein